MKTPEPGMLGECRKFLMNWHVIRRDSIDQTTITYSNNSSEIINKLQETLRDSPAHSPGATDKENNE